MPVRYIQCIYKQYVDTLMDKEKADASAKEQAMEEIEDAMTGG